MDEKNIERLEILFDRYPKLPNFITAGNVTLKAARSPALLNIDRYLMFDIFTTLIDIGAVNMTGAVSWRATPALVEYMEKRAK